MRFLAGLVHAAVASQVVFDSHDPLLPADRKGNMGSFGEYVSKYRQAAVRFRSPKAVDDACIEGPTIKNVTFTMDTVDVPPNTCLRVALCPSVNDMPDCTKSGGAELVSISQLRQQRVKLHWIPSSTIVLDPSTLYWITVSSTAEVPNAPIWLVGTKEFNTIDDPKGDVLALFTKSQDAPRNGINLGSNREVFSMQVNAD